MRQKTDPETRARLKAEILQHLATGATLRTVSALPDMPAWNRIRHWRTRDPAFDDAVAIALRRGKHHRFAAFDEALARAVTLRYAAGETLIAIAADPAMPTLDRITYWRLSQGEFGAEINRLKAVNTQVRRQIQSQRPQPWPYDQAMADRILVRVVKGEKLRAMLAKDPALPSGEVIKRWRREQPVFDRELAIAWRTGVRRRHRAHRRKTLGPEIALRISMGATLTSLGRQKKMPSADTMGRWLAEDPELAHTIHGACDWREMGLNDHMCDIAKTMPGLPIKDLKHLLAPLSRQESRLRNWPARRHRKDR